MFSGQAFATSQSMITDSNVKMMMRVRESPTEVLKSGSTIFVLPGYLDRHSDLKTKLLYIKPLFKFSMECNNN